MDNIHCIKNPTGFSVSCLHGQHCFIEVTTVTTDCLKVGSVGRIRSRASARGVGGVVGGVGGGVGACRGGGVGGGAGPAQA